MGDRALKNMNRTLNLVIVVVLLAQVSYQYVRLRDARTGIDERARTQLQQRAPKRDELARAGRWLHSFYRAEEGLQRPQGLWDAAGQEPDFDGLSAWLLDVYVVARMSGASEDAARQEVTKQIQQTAEWRSKHPDGGGR